LRGIRAGSTADRFGHVLRRDHEALQALAAAAMLEQEVALVAQRLGAAVAEDSHRVLRRLDLERDARGEVRLDVAGNDLDARTLRRQDE